MEGDRVIREGRVRGNPSRGDKGAPERNRVPAYKETPLCRLGTKRPLLHL